MAATSYQNWYVGQTYPSWDITLNTDAGPDDLTGVSASNFTMIFSNTSVRPAVDTTGTGTFTIKTVYPAEILYKPSQADVASAFNGVLIIQAYFPPSNTNADEVVYDPIPFAITAR
jgi:hypothetical protein